MDVSYYLTFVVLILGLSIADGFKCIGDLLKIINRKADAIVISWPLIFWILISLLIPFQYFAGIYHFKKIEINDTSLIIINLAIPSFLFLINRIAVPEFNLPSIDKSLVKGQYDLKDYYDKHRRTIGIIGFVLVLLFAINILLSHPFLEIKDESAIEYYLNHKIIFHILFVIIFYLIGFSKKKSLGKHYQKIHLSLSILAFLMTCGMIYQVITI